MPPRRASQGGELAGRNTMAGEAILQGASWAKKAFSLAPAGVARPGVTTLHYKDNSEGTLGYSSTTGTASWTAVDCRGHLPCSRGASSSGSGLSQICRAYGPNCAPVKGRAMNRGKGEGSNGNDRT